jgi:hypothetical protein
MWRLRHSLAICLSNLDVSISTSQKIKRKKKKSRKTKQLEEGPMAKYNRKEKRKKSDALL